MFYPDYVIEDIRQSSDLVSVVSQYTALKQNGTRYFGLCPFHNEKTASFSVMPDKQIYHCFGCGVSGNVITFVMQKENYDFVEAIKHLADRINYHLPEQKISKEYISQQETNKKLIEINTVAARFFHDNLNSDNSLTAKKYLETRRLSDGIVRKFGIGYSNRNGLYDFLKLQGYDDDLLGKSGLVIKGKSGSWFDRFSERLMFPIFSPQGKVVGFGGRTLGDDKTVAKYLNSPETPIFSKSKNLYGINFARQTASRTIILVEGYMDVLALVQKGFANTSASLGTAFNTDHATVLKRYCDSVVLIFDSDDAGEKAALRAIPTLMQSGLLVRVLNLQGAKDPDEFLNKFGKDAFSEAMKAAKSGISFTLVSASKKFDLSDPMDKVKFSQEGSRVIAGITNAVEREIYIKELSQLAGISTDSLAAEVAKISQKPEYRKLQKSKNTIFSGSKNHKKYDEARRSLLYWLSKSKKVAEKIIVVLSAEEFVEESYVKLFSLISERHDKNLEIVFADLVSKFETIDEQKKISCVFSDDFEYGKEVLGVLNLQIEIVKLAYIEFELEKLSKIENNTEESSNLDEKFQDLWNKKTKILQFVSNNNNWLK